MVGSLKWLINLLNKVEIIWESYRNFEKNLSLKLFCKNLLLFAYWTEEIVLRSLMPRCSSIRSIFDATKMSFSYLYNNPHNHLWKELSSLFQITIKFLVKLHNKVQFLQSTAAGTGNLLFHLAATAPMFLGGVILCQKM